MKLPFSDFQTPRAAIVLFLAASALFSVVKQASAQTENVLYSFSGSSDGGVPYAGLVSDQDGNLYGTTMQYGDGPCVFPSTGCGTVFEMMLTQEGGVVQWTFKLLHTFQGGSDGADPAGDLVLDSSGNLYGATTWGGGVGCAGYGCGTVFELERTGGGVWTEKVLHRFTGGIDGEDPVSSLTLDSQGNIYGTAAFGGDDTCFYDNAGTAAELYFD